MISGINYNNSEQWQSQNMKNKYMDIYSLKSGLHCFQIYFDLVSDKSPLSGFHFAPLFQQRYVIFKQIYVCGGNNFTDG